MIFDAVLAKLLPKGYFDNGHGQFLHPPIHGFDLQYSPWNNCSYNEVLCKIDG